MTDSAGSTRWTQHEDSAPSAHECLKPLEARSLFVGEEEKGSYFDHHCQGPGIGFSMLVGCGGQVQCGWNKPATWAAKQHFHTL